MVFMFYLHVWGSIIATAVALFGHLPMALLNMDDFKAMFGNGEVPMDTAKEHSPKWVEQDLVKTEKI